MSLPASIGPGVEDQLPVWPHWNCGEGYGVVGWSRVCIIKKMFSSGRPPFSCSFAQGNRLFLELFFFLSMPVGHSRLEASAVHCPQYRGHKEAEETHYHAVPQVLRSWTINSLLSIFQSLLLLVCVLLPGLFFDFGFLVVRGRRWQEWGCSILYRWKWKLILDLRAPEEGPDIKSIQ